jgi:hypothetical protein
MWTKLQIGLGILAGLAIVVFFLAVITNAQVKNFETVPGWQALVVWASFGLIIACSLGVIVTQVLEFREPKVKKEVELAAEGETPAKELAAVGATVESESPAEGGAAGGAIDEIDAIAREPAEAGDRQTEVATTEEFASNFDDFTTDFADFEEEK